LHYPARARPGSETWTVFPQVAVWTPANRSTVGIVNEGAKTIALTVPFGTSVTALVATFTTTGTAVSVRGTVQESGTTPSDFTNPVTYTVTAADGSTQAYVITVAVAAALAIGDAYGGGIVAYILQQGACSCRSGLLTRSLQAFAGAAHSERTPALIEAVVTRPSGSSSPVAGSGPVCTCSKCASTAGVRKRERCA